MLEKKLASIATDGEPREAVADWFDCPSECLPYLLSVTELRFFLPFLSKLCRLLVRLSLIESSFISMAVKQMRREINFTD